LKVEGSLRGEFGLIAPGVHSVLEVVEAVAEIAVVERFGGGESLLAEAGEIARMLSALRSKVADHGR